MKKLQSYILFIILLAALLPAAIPPYSASAQSGYLEAEIQPDGNSGYDARIYSAETTTNYAASETIAAGNTASGTYRSVITWDFSTFPSDAEVTEAVLSLWVAEDLATNASTLQAFVVTSAWDESTVTWAVPWTTAGGEDDILETPSGTASLAADLAVSSRVDITLTPEDIGNMIRANYFGILLRTGNESNDAYSFYSSDYVTDEDLRPMLAITYDPDPPMVDPGWKCIEGFECPDDIVLSPYYKQHNSMNIANTYGDGAWLTPTTLTSAQLQCSPWPKCQNDYPVYYKIVYRAHWWWPDYHPEWYTYNYISPTLRVAVSIPGGSGSFNDDMLCGYAQGNPYNPGFCTKVITGVLPASALQDIDGGYTVGVTAKIFGDAGFGGLASSFLWTISFSRAPIAAECADQYVVPTVDTYPIDPTIELPVGMVGEPDPQDYQGIVTVPNSIYMIRFRDGPWNNGTEDMPIYNLDFYIEGMVGTYVPISYFLLFDAVICYEIDTENNTFTIYFTAPDDNFYFRVSDTVYTDNTNDPETPLQYDFGLAYSAENGCSQFTYSSEDLYKSIEVPSLDDDVPVYDEQIDPIIGGEWYGIQVDSGTWNEDSPSTPRIDMEFSFIVYGPQQNPPPWQVLAEGSPLVACVSTDGKMTFVQAPLDEGLVLHLRVNDQDDPQNFSDNTGTLQVSVYHVANTYTPSGCAADYNVDDLVASGNIDGAQINGKSFANNFGSLDGFGNVIPGGVSTSYYMTPGGWYMLETRDGPWTASSESGGSYVDGQDYFDVQIRLWASDFDSDTWRDPDEWGLSTCVVNVDMLGHQRIYFRVPDNAVEGESESGAEFMIRVAGASNSTTGQLGWDLYQAVDVETSGEENPWDSCLVDYNSGLQLQQAWIPVKAVEGASITQNVVTGGGTTMLEAGVTYRLQTGNGPWQDGENPDDMYSAEISNDGGSTWFAFGDHPDITCGVVDQLGQYGIAIFTVATDQVWKIRVADTETEIFTDNTGSLSYKLWRSYYMPTYEGDGTLVSTYNDMDFDACQPMLIRPVFNNISEFPTRDTPTLPSTWDVSDWVTYLGEWFASIGDFVGELAVYLGDLLDDVGDYISGWSQYISRMVVTYFAWCPRHTNVLVVEFYKLRDREPLASIYELDTAADTTISEIKGYDWGAGGEGGGIAGEDYEDTSIFSFGEGGGDDENPETVNNIINKVFPNSGRSNDVWDDGDLVDFSASDGTPEYYDTCTSLFSDTLPARLRMGVCFASAWWKETGASWWIQLSLDISTVFVLIYMIKGAVQSLVYMMTGVRPWTKDGASKIIINAAEHITERKK